MQKSIILPVLFALFFSLSCNKSNTQTQAAFQNYLKLKVDNVQTVCNAHIRATYLPPTIGPDNIITISGDWDGGSVALKLNESEVLTPGTYIFQNGTLRLGEIWTSGPNGRYYSASFGGDFSPTVYGSGRIVITEISAEYVKGSFDFVTYIDNATITFKAVTAGEFHIRRG